MIPIIIVEAINEVIGKKDMCIYGTADLREGSEKEKEAFRLGSNLAFKECAEILEKAIAELKKQGD
jgi:hypothetical protein